MQSELLDRTPPNSQEAEKSLIGSVLLVPELMDDVSWLPARDFYGVHNKIIWGALLDIHTSRVRLDEATLSERLRQLGKYEEVGGRVVIYGLADDTPSPGSASEMARAVQALAALRRTAATSLELFQACYQTGSPEEILLRAEAKLSSNLNEIAASVNRKRTVTLKEACLEHLDRLGLKQGALLPSGLSELDDALGGGAALGEMVVVGARPSHGKTLIALQWLEAAAARGVPSMIVSQEMSIDAIGRRGLQRATSLEEGEWLEHRDSLRAKVLERFDGHSDVHIAAAVGSTTAACLEIDRLCTQKGVKVVAVDYAQLLKGRGEGRYEQVTNTSQDFKQCAARNGCLLILLAQLSRKIDDRPDQTPLLSDLRESGQLEQDADVVLFLQWPWKINPEEPQERYRIFQAKNRNRGIRKPVVEVEINASRQTLSSRRLGEHFTAESLR